MSSNRTVDLLRSPVMFKISLSERFRRNREVTNWLSVPGGPEGGPDAITTGGGLGGAWTPPIKSPRV